MIRKIQEEAGTQINVEDDGSVEIAAVSGENSRKAITWIESLTRDVEIGSLYLGKVTRIMGFGAFVEILPGKEGLVRIGELADYHVPSVEDVVQVGDEIMVKVIEIDNLGRINLSRRAVLEGEGGTDGEFEEHPGEIPSPMTRRTSTLSPNRPMQPRPPRQNGGGGGGGGGFRRGPRRPGGGPGGGPGGPRPPRPMGR